MSKSELEVIIFKAIDRNNQIVDEGYPDWYWRLAKEISEVVEKYYQNKQ